MKIHEIKGYIQSIYLIQEENGLLLLDGCCRCDVEVVKDFIEGTLKMTMADLKAVIVTHMHPDHAGGANIYKEKYNCKVYSKEGADNWYNGFWGILKFYIDLMLTHYVAKKMKKNKKPISYSRKLKSDGFLDEGSTVENFPDWKVLFCPGHTDSDLSLYHQKSETIYIADNIIKVRSSYVAPYPVNYPALYKQSLKRYTDLKIERYLLAHGGEVSISNAQIKELISTTSNRPTNHRELFKRLTRNFKKNNYFAD